VEGSGIVEYLFLSVAAVCATALMGFQMHLRARPACSRAEFDSLKAEIDKQTDRINKLTMAGMSSARR
jgi:hypothetical protein